MDSIDNETEIDGKAWIAFQECSSALEKEQLAVELRPRFRDEETAFTGDYDYLMDVSRFGEIVKLFSGSVSSMLCLSRLGSVRCSSIRLC